MKKRLGPFDFTIDRPKGTVKEWPQPDGSTKRFTYPCDYGYWPKIKGEDGEGLDAFVGNDPGGHKESFQKLKPDGTPDETKFLLGVTDKEREVIYGLYMREVHARRVYEDWDEVQTALEAFQGKQHKTAAHKHRWTGGYVGGFGWRHCTACDTVEEVFPSGPPKPASAKDRAFVLRRAEKSAAFRYGEKLALDFSSMNWIPSNFAGHVQSPGQIMQAAQTTPALAGTQENIRMLQLAQDPYGTSAPQPVHHHRRHHF